MSEQINNGTKFRILILDKENNADRIRRRIKKIFLGYGLSENAEGSIWFDPDITLNQPHTRDFSELSKIIEEKKINVLVVDSLVRFFNGQENSVDDVKEIYKTLRQLRDKHNLTIIILHHTRKSPGIKTAQDLRGSFDLVAAVDELFMLNKIRKNVYRLSQHKNRDSENIPDITFKVVDKIIDNQEAIYLEDASLEDMKVESTIDSAKNSIKSWIKESKIKDFRTKETLAKHIDNHSKSAINGALEELCSEGYIKKLRQGRWRVSEGGDTKLPI